jgi:putative transposase
MSRKYKFYNKLGLYFVSFAVVNWIAIFTRQLYFNILSESIDCCRAERGMELYCYYIMPNHVHLVFRSIKDQPMELLRDLKKYTSKRIIASITTNN